MLLTYANSIAQLWTTSCRVSLGPREQAFPLTNASPVAVSIRTCKCKQHHWPHRNPASHVTTSVPHNGDGLGFRGDHRIRPTAAV